MAIISMPQRTMAKITKSTIMIEEELPIRKKSITRYRQDFDNKKSEDSNEEEK
jgi:hypothetical protein